VSASDADDPGDLAGDPCAQVLQQAERLPPGALEALFGRYGRPLDGAEPELSPVVHLEGGATRLGRFTFRAPVDVVANDYFLWCKAGAAPLAMPGPLFAAAVAALSRRR